MSHAWPHALQFDVVERFVSQPLVSGGVVLQSAHPGAQLAYVHALPVHVSPTLCAVSQLWPHPAQFVLDAMRVSQPSVSGGVVLQSAQPGWQPW